MKKEADKKTVAKKTTKIKKTTKQNEKGNIFKTVSAGAGV